MAYVNHLLTFIESNPALAVGFNLILLLLSAYLPIFYASSC